MADKERSSEKPSTLQFKYPEGLKPVTKEGMDEFRRSSAYADAVLDYYQQIEDLPAEERLQYERYKRRHPVYLPLPLKLGE